MLLISNPQLSTMFYLACIRKRYHNSGKKQKTAILDEFCQNCGYSRKDAVRILNGTGLLEEGPFTDPLRFSISESFTADVKVLLEILIEALPHWVPHFYSPGFTPSIGS